MGVPLAAQMKAGEAGPELQFYRSGIVNGSGCPVETSDHQITLVGYGHYQTTPVWLFLNSWGFEWGTQGYFMVEQGSNDYCIESTVYGVLPRFFGYSSSDWTLN